MCLASKTKPCRQNKGRGLPEGWNGVIVVLTILVHGRLKALGEATGATLIAMGLVHRTATLQIAGGFAGVNAIAMNAPLEEARAA